MASAEKKLVLATNNKNKKIEIENLLKGTNISVIGVEGDFNPEETGETFEENAYIKAYSAARIMNAPAIADDSGLVIDALGGLPGIHSSRFEENDKKRIQKVINMLQDVPQEKRTARFICAMVLVDPAGQVLHSCNGVCEGYIIDTPTGENGFGYDPIFYIPELNATMAELSLEDKNKISHRSKALRCMINWLKSEI